jgi:hypothetical protein
MGLLSIGVNSVRIREIEATQLYRWWKITVPFGKGSEPVLSLNDLRYLARCVQVKRYIRRQLTKLANLFMDSSKMVCRF